MKPGERCGEGGGGGKGCGNEELYCTGRTEMVSCGPSWTGKRAVRRTRVRRRRMTKYGYVL